MTEGTMKEGGGSTYLVPGQTYLLVTNQSGLPNKRTAFVQFQAFHQDTTFHRQRPHPPLH